MVTETDQGQRKYPLRKPPGHKPLIPRWLLRFPDTVDHLYTLYIGIQSHTNDAPVEKIDREILSILNTSDAVVDHLRVTHGFDLIGTRIYVCYWTSPEPFQATRSHLNLLSLWNSVGVEEKRKLGLWIETLQTPISRLEGNYASLAHKPGAAQLPGVTQPAHTLTAYWGSARDRIPDAANDLFQPPEDATTPAAPILQHTGFNERLFGTNYDNMAHIRSGQYWAACPPAEAQAYETLFQPKLMAGMAYLWDHPEETGTLGLRFVESLDPTTHAPRKETAGVGWFRNWADLEKWSSSHPSHLAIFKGALEHARRFGEERKFMTWHEVSVLKRGEGGFEYVNCDPRTGVIRWVPLESERL